MKEIQREGTSPEKVIKEFLKEFNLQKEDISYTVIEKGSRGLFNLVGQKQAIVKFMIPEEEDMLRRFLDGLLCRMDIEFKNMDVSYKDNYYYISVSGLDNPGFIIGKEGKMLNSIQHLLNRVLENGDEERSRVILDVDNYRETHEKRLQSKISQIVKKIKKREKSITLEPMSASDRRIVYRFLDKEPDFTTMTIGKGDSKRIVIYPANDTDKKVQEQPRPQQKRHRKPQNDSGRRKRDNQS